MTTRAKAPERVKADLKIRLPEDLADQIRDAADDENSSMNAVMVQRLRRSFEDQKSVLQALELSFGSELAALLLLAGKAMHQTAAAAPILKPGADWLNDRWAFEQVYSAAANVFSHAAPEGRSEAPTSRFAAGHRHHGKDTEGAADIGERNALGLIHDMGRAEKDQGEARAWFRAIAAMGGNVCKRMVKSLRKASK